MPIIRGWLRLVLFGLGIVVITVPAAVFLLIRFNSLSGVRWWRCYGSERPVLTRGPNSWEVEYQYGGGFGSGDVTVKVRGDGSASLDAYPPVGSRVARVAMLSRETVDRLASRVDETGLLCQSTEPRAGYRIYDIGRASLTVRRGDYEKTVFIDECNDLPDSMAFDDTVQEILDLEPFLGEEVALGPMGAAVVSEPCHPECGFHAGRLLIPARAGPAFHAMPGRG